jgi:hypothetical protein
MDNSTFTEGKRVSKFEHTWQLKTKDICRNSWLTAYSFSSYEINLCSATLHKSSDAMAPVRSGTNRYTDATLHDYTFHEAEDIFEENLGESYGNCLSYIIYF